MKGLNPGVIHTVNPLLSLPGGLVYFKLIWGGEGGLNRDGGLIWAGGGLFHLETTMVSVLHKEIEYKLEMLKYKTF